MIGTRCENGPFAGREYQTWGGRWLEIPVLTKDHRHIRCIYEYVRVDGPWLIARYEGYREYDDWKSEACG